MPATAPVHNELMRPVLNRSFTLYYEGVGYPAGCNGEGPTSPLDAYAHLWHAWLYGPTSADEITPERIIYSRYPSKTTHTTFRVEGQRVMAEKETVIIEGDAEAMLPLVQFACQMPCDGKQPTYIEGLSHVSYLPALLLRDLICIEPQRQALLRDYGITEGIIEHLKVCQRRPEPGSWLNIVAAVELWMEGESSLQDALMAI